MLRYAYATVLLPLLSLYLSGCSTLAPALGGPPKPPRAISLLEKVPEKETTRLTERREDVEINTRDFDRIPRVVARGETELLRLEGARARLFGDAGGQDGWSVDNVLLLEVVDEADNIIGRMAIGSSDAVLIGSEMVDNVGERSFTFEPGEVDITSHLPERKPFKLRATVLDYSGVGKVSDVFVILDTEARSSSEDDDLRYQ